LEFIDTVQAPGPEQAPDHPANVESSSGVAVRVTSVPNGKIWQPAPQEAPGGEKLTLPVPDPDVVVVRVNTGTCVHVPWSPRISPQP
jgi:hypothetical protein